MLDHHSEIPGQNPVLAGLMITASHQTFSGQLWHLTDQTKFDQTNLLYIINGEVYKFTIGKQMSGQFSTLIISTVLAFLTYTMPWLLVSSNLYGWFPTKCPGKCLC